MLNSHKPPHHEAFFWPLLGRADKQQAKSINTFGLFIKRGKPTPFPSHFPSKKHKYDFEIFK